MGLLHRAFLFDGVGFRAKAIPLIASLDAGNVYPLYTEALRVAQTSRPDQWALRIAGATLRVPLDISTISLEQVSSRNENFPRSGVPPWELGYWLLLVFSTFLQRCIGIGRSYLILDYALEVLGWTVEERQELMVGKHTSMLLKPDHAPAAILDLSDPYWLWMRPDHAHRNGWISCETASYLLNILLDAEGAIRSFSAQAFRASDGMSKLAVEDMQQAQISLLNTAFDRAVTMLRSAKNASMDLYMVVSD